MGLYGWISKAPVRVDESEASIGLMDHDGVGNHEEIRRFALFFKKKSKLALQGSCYVLLMGNSVFLIRSLKLLKGLSGHLAYYG